LETKLYNIIPKSNEGLKYERYIIFIFILPAKVFPFMNHVFEFFFFQIMVIEMLFNNKIQIFFFQNGFIFSLKIYTIVYIIERNEQNFIFFIWINYQKDMNYQI
jgi:hypothetical protein